MKAFLAIVLVCLLGIALGIGVAVLRIRSAPWNPVLDQGGRDEPVLNRPAHEPAPKVAVDRHFLETTHPTFLTTQEKKAIVCIVGQTFLSAEIVTFQEADKNVCPTVVRNANCSRLPTLRIRVRFAVEEQNSEEWIHHEDEYHPI